jgi:hypothetical protein
MDRTALYDTNIAPLALVGNMSSQEDPTKRKSVVNETGRREVKDIDPKDIDQIRKNLKSNEEERENSSSQV